MNQNITRRASSCPSLQRSSQPYLRHDLRRLVRGPQDVASEQNHRVVLSAATLRRKGREPFGQ
jgi:hypothetical protein